MQPRFHRQAGTWGRRSLSVVSSGPIFSSPLGSQHVLRLPEASWDPHRQLCGRRQPSSRDPCRMAAAWRSQRRQAPVRSELRLWMSFRSAGGRVSLKHDGGSCRSGEIPKVRSPGTWAGFGSCGTSTLSRHASCRIRSTGPDAGNRRTMHTCCSPPDVRSTTPELSTSSHQEVNVSFLKERGNFLKCQGSARCNNIFLNAELLCFLLICSQL